jgi:DNA mismatch repair ATPase MutL
MRRDTDAATREHSMTSEKFLVTGAFGCIGAWAKQTLLESSGTVSYRLDDAPTQRSDEYQKTLRTSFTEARHYNVGQVHDSAYEVKTAEVIAGIGLRHELEHAHFAGSFRKKYLLFDADEMLLVMDQHAAHERINYERFRTALDARNIETQSLLAPVTLALSPFETIEIEKKLAEISQMGFDVVLWDAQTVAINAHPALFRDPVAAVRNLLAGSCADLRLHDKAARMACRASVMSGDRITMTEAENIKKQLLACENPFTCPHGRPTVIELSESDLAKQFLR